MKCVSCVLCNEPHNVDFPSTTEMDHVQWLDLSERWIKLDPISRLCNGGSDLIILNEMTKCRPLCIHCHRLHTIEQKETDGYHWVQHMFGSVRW